MKRIIFVCSKNGFRSPSAELLLKNILKKNKIKDIEVSSAGVKEDWELDERDRELLKVLSKALKYDYLKRRRRKLNENTVKKADKIIVFQDSHRKFIESRYPESEGKIFLFNELINIKDESRFCDLKAKKAHIPEYTRFYNLVKKLMEIYLDKIIE